MYLSRYPSAVPKYRPSILHLGHHPTRPLCSASGALGANHPALNAGTSSSSSQVIPVKYIKEKGSLFLAPPLAQQLPVIHADAAPGPRVIGQRVRLPAPPTLGWAGSRQEVPRTSPRVLCLLPSLQRHGHQCSVQLRQVPSSCFPRASTKYSHC